MNTNETDRREFAPQSFAAPVTSAEAIPEMTLCDDRPRMLAASYGVRAILQRSGL